MKKRPLRTIIYVICLTAAVCLTVQGQNPADPQPLAPGQTIEREMTGAETHRYKFDLKKDEFFQVRVEQKGVDVALKLLDAAGKVLATMDSPNGKEGPETLSFVPETTGEFVLEVSGFDAKDEKYIYAIKREAPRIATAQDRRRVEIEKLFVDGIVARDKGQTEASITQLEEASKGWRDLKDDHLLSLTTQTLGSLKIQQADALSKTDRKQEAAMLYEAASKLYGTSGNKPLEMIYLLSAAQQNNLLGENKKAIEFADQALTFFQTANIREFSGLTELQKKQWQITALQTLLISHEKLDDWERSIELHKQLIVLYREIADKPNEILFTSSIGTNLNTLGRPREAISYFESALSLLATTEPTDFAVIEKYNPAVRKRLELNAVNGIGQAHHNLGENQKALEYFHRALEICDEIGDKTRKQSLLLGLSNIFESLYQWENALDAAKQSLELAENLGDDTKTAFTLNAIGRIYHGRSEKKTALEYYERALKLVRTFEVQLTKKVDSGFVKRIEASVLNNIGLVYSDLGENQKALDFYNQSLKIRRETDSKDEEATTLSNIAYIYSDWGDKQKALEYLKRARETFAQASPQIKASSRFQSQEADALKGIGAINRELGNLNEALNYFNQALTIARSKGLKHVESAVLNNLGNTYSNLGELRKSLDFYYESLSLARQTGDKEGEIVALINIGNALIEMGDNRGALPQLEQALMLAKIIESKGQLAAVLSKLGKLYAYQSEYEKGLEYYNQSLTTAREIGDKASIALALADIGLIYSDLSEWEKSLDYYGQALVLIREIGSKSNEAVGLSNIGQIFFALGENQKALAFYDQSLEIAKRIGDKGTESYVLVKIGRIQAEIGEKQKAAASYERALVLSRGTGYKSAEIGALLRLGVLRAELGDTEEGLSLLKESLELARKHIDRPNEVRCLNAIGMISAGKGETRNALDLLNQALPSAKEIGDKDGQAATLKNLMLVWKQLKNPSVAIFYGKQAINEYQEIRYSIRSLEKQTQDIFREKITAAYRSLADLLIAEGRFAEAEYVLRMLKEDEYSKFVRRDPEEIKQLSQRLDPASKEKPILEKYSSLAENVAKIGVEFEKLKEDANRPNFAQQERLKEVGEQLKIANSAFRIFLDRELVAEFGKIPKRNVKSDLEEVERGRQENLKKWNAVSIYTVVGEKRYRVFLTTPSVQTDGKKEISEKELNEKIFAFRDALQNPNIDPRPLGKELYDILLKPIEKQIKDSGSRTLLFSLDGALRYIPIGALWDGEKYLAEDYQIVLLTAATKEKLGDALKNDWKIFGGGVTAESDVLEPERAHFKELSAVNKELNSIVREMGTEGFFPGRKFIDKNLTSDVIEQTLKDFTVLHLATHFKLGRDDSTSFLLLGNNQTLTLNQISDSPNMKFDKIDLIVLSACETAFGKSSEMADGGEVDSLATFLVSRGARSVIASLWSVADDSTSELMIEFYKNRMENPDLSKAEALRKAQLTLMQGKYKTGETPSWRGIEIQSTEKNIQPIFKTDEKAPYAHPYYWAPFVLIGNWK